MLILGIDPGTAITGWGVVDFHPPNRFEIIAYDCIYTKSHQPLPDRLLQIYQQLQQLLNQYQPETVAMESLFFNTNAKTAMLVGQARGVVKLALVQSGLTIQEYTPLQVKTTLTGYGRADKKQIQFMVQQILKLPQLPQPDDAADALAIAVTHAFYHHTHSAMQAK